MFFRCGDLIVEVVHRPKDQAIDKTRDSLWGLSWRVDDIEATRARLLRRRLGCAHRPQTRHPRVDGAKRHLRHSDAAGGTVSAAGNLDRIHADDIRDMLDAIARQ